MKPIEQVENMLISIKELTDRIAGRQAQAQVELEALRIRYNDVDEMKGSLADLDKSLKKLLKSQAEAVFNGSDRVESKNGVLIHDKKDKVRIPKDALQRIKDQGWTEGIKVVESIERPIIEKWTDERLAAIGAERKPTDIYEYEVK